VTLLCVDPGLAETGLAVLDGTENEARRFDSAHVRFTSRIQTFPRDRLEARLMQLRPGVAWVFSQQPRIERALIELPPAKFFRPGKTARVINAVAVQMVTLATGALVDAIGQHLTADQIEFVPPVGNYRIGGRVVREEIKKRIARQVVRDRYALDVSEHVAEAILLGCPATTAEIAHAWARLAAASGQ